MKPTQPIFNAVSVTGTNTYRSDVVRAPQGLPVEYGITIETTVVTGTLALEVNNKSHQDYSNDVANASGGLEANNTAGWVQRDLSPSATIAVGAGGTFTITLKNRFARWRLKYVNATGTGTITARVSLP